MAQILVGIDLGQSPLRVGGLVLAKYIVAQGTKDIKVNGLGAPSERDVVEVFQDANQVVKSYFGAPEFQAAVVVVPNSTNSGNREVVAGAARAVGFNIIQVINENNAIAVAYAEKVKPSLTRRLAIVSVTGGVLDVSIISVKSVLEFELVAQETHSVPIEFEEPKAPEGKHFGPGGLIGLVGGVVGGAVKTLVVDPLDKVFDIIKKLLSSPKLSESPVDEVVFVGKASKSEKLKEAVKERFSSAKIWSSEEIGEEELAAYGAAVIAFKQKPAEPSFEIPPAKLPANDEDLDSGKGNLEVVEEKHMEEGDEEVKDQSSKKFVPVSSVIF